MTMPLAQPRSTSSTAFSTTANSADQLQDGPVRSRNARAQARHRAKRKAYIEQVSSSYAFLRLCTCNEYSDSRRQLEENVAKLQAILGLTPEQVQALPAAPAITNKLQELEGENIRLRRELDLWRTSQPQSQVPPFVHPAHDRWSPDSNSDHSSHSIQYHPGPLSPQDQVAGPPFSKKRKVSSDDSACSPANYSVLASALFRCSVPRPLPPAPPSSVRIGGKSRVLLKTPLLIPIPLLPSSL